MGVCNPYEGRLRGVSPDGVGSPTITLVIQIHKLFLDTY